MMEVIHHFIVSGDEKEPGRMDIAQVLKKPFPFLMVVSTLPA